MPEHTIAENLTRLTAARTAIAGAITAKGGTVTVGDGLEDFPTDIATIPSGGGGSASENDVTFYDYDGTVVNAYSKTDFLALSAMPANPSHEGLTAQGWNWSLADAKAYVTKYGRLNIGQMYITSDGKTRIKIKLEEGRLSPVLGLGINGSVDVDWGDGTTHETMTSINISRLEQLQHAYATAGEYTISLTVTGSMAFLGDSTYSAAILRKAGVISAKTEESRTYQNAIQELYIGSGVISIDNYAFRYCCSLTSITIPDSVTSIGTYVFYYCCSLTSVTIPDSVTSIGTYVFRYCYSLTSVTIPDSVTSIGDYAFYQCYSLASVTIPDGVTSINSSAFGSCYSLASVTIPDSVIYIRDSAFGGCYSLTSVTIPDGVMVIGNNAFGGCYSLTSITIPDSAIYISGSFNDCYSLTSITIPDGVTSISGSTFYNCYSLTSVTIPDSVTSIGGSAFYYCYSLTSITIPDSVTSIDTYAFSSCYSLTSVTIPDGVTTIGTYAFYQCCGLGFIKFEGSMPPTASSSRTFQGVPTDCIIYVPSGSLSAYTSATNYPDPNTYTYVEY